ncbi:MAG: DUF4423 domain-containing protein [Bacteriovoracaceae bacterium]
MDKLNLTYIDILQSELGKRKNKNPLYSMRAFSKSLMMNSGVLSLIINGKRIPSLIIAEQLVNNLNVSQEERKAFIDSVVKAQRGRKLQRVSKSIKKYKFTLEDHSSLKFKKLEEDYYQTVSDWHHFTILEMTQLKDFKSSHKWIAGQLGLTEIDVKLAIERLLNLGLLKMNEEGEYQATDAQRRLDQMYTATSHARREKQKQIRNKAIESIENDPIDKRSMTSMTMCIDVELVAEAKKLIADFNESMCKLLESGKKEKVYALEVSLFPLQK